MHCCYPKKNAPKNSQRPALVYDEPKTPLDMALSLPSRISESHDEAHQPVLPPPTDVYRPSSMKSFGPQQNKDPDYYKPPKYENSTPGIRRPSPSLQTDLSSRFSEDFSVPRSPSAYRASPVRYSAPPTAYSSPTIAKNRPSSIADSVDTRAEPIIPDLSPTQARMCVAVDLGTVLSGVACGISSNKVQQILWPGSHRKIPTCLVYDAAGRVTSWGQDAKKIPLQKGWIRCEM